MTFSDDVRRFTLKVEVKSRDAFLGVVSAVQQSIQNGSVVTGAPGQPVDTGRLRASWQTVFEGPDAAVVGTNVVYAPFIEDGIAASGKPIQFRSAVGGPHSVKLTVASFDRLVAVEAEKVRDR